MSILNRRTIIEEIKSFPSTKKIPYINEQLKKTHFIDFYKDDNPRDLRSIFISDIDIPHNRVYYYVDYPGIKKQKIESHMVTDTIYELISNGYSPIFL